MSESKETITVNVNVEMTADSLKAIVEMLRKLKAAMKKVFIV